MVAIGTGHIEELAAAPHLRHPAVMEHDHAVMTFHPPTR